VTRPRIHEELQALIRLNCSCSPEERRSFTHTYAELYSKHLEVVPGTEGCFLICTCIHCGIVDDKEEVALNKFHRRKHWPWSIRSILPHGAAPTIQGICQWMSWTSTQADRTEIFDCLEKILSILPSLVIPHLISSRPFQTCFAGLNHAAAQLFSEYQSSLKHQVQEQLLIDMLDDCTLGIQVVSRVVFKSGSQTEKRVLHQIAAPELIALYENSMAAAHCGYEMISSRSPPALPPSSRRTFSPRTVELVKFLKL
jgi:hypothetical protein